MNQLNIRLPNDFVVTIRTDRVESVQLDQVLRDNGLVVPMDIVRRLIGLARNEVTRRERNPSSEPCPVDHASLSLVEVQVGDHYQEVVNQGLRDCYVLAVHRTRYRIEFDMPNCIQQGFRPGVTVNGKMFRPVIKIVRANKGSSR